MTATGNGSIPLGSNDNSTTAPYDYHIATVNIQGNQKDVKPAEYYSNRFNSKERSESCEYR